MILSSITGQIGRLTLNNPDKHNALDRAAMQQISDVLASWRGSDIRAVIFDAKGKSFCSGVAIDQLGDGDWAENPLEPLCDAIENFPAPVICALQGGVYGGGVDLALACDFRIGVHDLKMFVPPAQLGIHYHASGINRAVQRLGAQMARRVFLLAEKFEGQDLLNTGFLDFQVATDALENHVQNMAHKIANLAPMAVQGMKQTIVEISNNSLDTQAAAQRVVDCFASDDHAEALLARQEKRAPVFKGI